MYGCSGLLNSSMNKNEQEPVETKEQAVEEAEAEVKEEISEDSEEPEEPIEIEEEVEKELETDETISQGDYNVYIGGEVIETDDKIIINGESNLIPGARVVGEVSVGKNIRYIFHPKVEDVDYLDDTSEIVDDDGSFYMELSHPNLDEETEVAVKFHFDGQQNDDVIRHYGDRGQKLEGPYIYKHQGEVGGRGPDNIFNKAEVKTVFMPEKEKAVRQFKEPDWYEDVDDLGDTRVWIEVDEINDDGDYFYVHGRSNLIEGSRINIRRNHSKEAETMVNPDGSFNFKFDYEYKEDVPFIIEFDPNDYQ